MAKPDDPAGGSEMGRQTEKSLLFTPAFDRYREENAEATFIMVIQALNTYWAEYHSDYIVDSEAVGTIKGLIEPVKILLMKEEEEETLTQVKAYEESIKNETILPTLDTIANLKILEEIFVRAMAKNGHRDRKKIKYSWEENFFRRLRLPKLTQPHFSYFFALPTMEDKIAWLQTYHTVMNGGDIHALWTGINNSGKSNGAIHMLMRCNWYYRNYWWPIRATCRPDREIFSFQEVDDAKDAVPIPEFDLSKNVVYLPVNSSLDELLGDTQYELRDLNEGMKFANNLRSMDARVVDAGTNAYIARAHFPIVYYEYQVSKRPPGLLMERFNMWFHKMSKPWAVLSMASGLFRKTDPYYLKRIDKLDDDDEINDWIQNKNPNYICELQTGVMERPEHRAFKKFQKKAHLEMLRASLVKKKIGDEMLVTVEDYWTLMDANLLARSDLEDKLKKDYPDLNKLQVRNFIKSFEDYDLGQKFSKRRKVEAVASQ